MMKSFSLGKLKTKVGRRFSDPSDFDRAELVADQRRNSGSNVVIVVSESDPLHAASTFSIQGDRIPRLRSRSISKKQAKELIRHETSQVIQKKLFTILKDLGLQLPIPLKTTTGVLNPVSSKSIKIYVANTNDCVYLAPSSSTSFTYEDVENGGNHIPESDSAVDLNGFMEDGVRNSANSTPRSSICSSLDAMQERPPEGLASAIIETITKKMKASKSTNYLCTQIDSQTSIPHLFAVIVELSSDTPMKTVEVEFSSTIRIQWPTMDNANRHHCEEKFKIGQLEWELALQDADYYINTKNTKDARLKEINPNHLAKKTREFRLFDARKTSSDLLDDSTIFSSSRRSSDTSFSAGYEASSEVRKAGLYVFLLPILLPPNIPASVNTANGSLTHKLSVKVPGPQERLSKKSATKADYALPMVRTPPSLANSIADKPIYINRVWNESLHYSITFPKKYVSLGSEHTINVKLVPLAKDVTVKRIKFNILERVTYVSRDLSREYEYDGDDPFARLKNPKSKERVVALCELRTKTKTNYSGLEPFKEEVLSCPENNLLYSCYEQGKFSSNNTRSKDSFVMVASPLDINIALPFLTSRVDKEIMTSSLGDNNESMEDNLSPLRSRSHSSPKRDSIASLECPSSPVIGSLETHISHMNGGHISLDMDEDVLKLDSSLSPKKHTSRDRSMSQGYTITAKALSPDSNFRHIQISHRLQVSFRISKPDPSDNNKMHHYEVVVDTPIILLSAKCSDGALQLPEYAEAGAEPIEEQLQRPGVVNFRMPSYERNGISIKPFDPNVVDQLPSFEEATSTPTTPVVRASSITSIDPGFSSDPPAYENVPISNAVSSNEEALMIDDVLISADNYSERKPSSIHASLQSSFANSQSSASHVSGNSEARSSENSAFSSSKNYSGDVTSSESSSLQSMRSGLERACLNELDSPASIEDASSDPLTKCSDVHSLIEEDVQFEQRLPLLRNESMIGVEPQVTKLSIKDRDDSSKNWKTASSDTLDERSHVPSLFHAF